MVKIDNNKNFNLETYAELAWHFKKNQIIFYYYFISHVSIYYTNSALRLSHMNFLLVC